MAIRFEAQIARGVERKIMVRGAVKRGLEIVVLAYALPAAGVHPGRLLGLARPVSRRHPELHRRVDDRWWRSISAPRGGRPSDRRHLAGRGASCIALGPIVGPAYFPDWLPKPLTSYIGGQRPMARFPLVPQLAWALVGVVIGHWWVQGEPHATGWRARSSSPAPRASR